MRRMKVVELAQQTAKHFEYVEGRFARMDERFEQIDQRFDRVEDRLAILETQMATMREDIIQAVEERFGPRFERIIALIEGLAGRMAAWEQEQTMLVGLVARHERWIGELADRAGHRLVP